MLINSQKSHNQNILQSFKSSFIKSSEICALKQDSQVRKIALAVINLLLIPFRLAQGAYYRLLKVKSEPKKGFFNHVFDGKTSIRELNQSTILKTALVGVGAAGLIAFGHKPSTQNSQMGLLSGTHQFALGISSLPVIYSLNLLLSNKKENNNELSFKDLPKDIIANISCFSDNRTAGSFNVATGLRYADYATRKEALAKKTINKIRLNLGEDVSKFEEIEQILSVKHLSYLEKLEAIKSLIENEIDQIEAQMLSKVMKSSIERVGLRLSEIFDWDDIDYNHVENILNKGVFTLEILEDVFMSFFGGVLSKFFKGVLSEENSKRINEEFNIKPTKSSCLTEYLRKKTRTFLEIIDRKGNLEISELFKSLEDELIIVEKTIKKIRVNTAENIVRFIKSPLRTDIPALGQIKCADLLVDRFERRMRYDGTEIEILCNTEELQNNIKTIKDLDYPLAEKAVRINSLFSDWFEQENINQNITFLYIKHLFYDLRDDLSVVLIPCIFELTSLTKLDLGETGLTSIPKELNKLENLEELNLEANKLSFVPCVSGLKKLRILNLQQNRIREISDDLLGESNSLIKLNLSNNLLTKIPNSSFSNLNSLTTLLLSYNLLTEIPSSIRNLTGLKHLLIIENKISSISDDFFGKLNSLTEVSLSSNLLTEIPNSIRDLTGLKYLDIEKNKISSISDDFFSKSNLIALDLSYNLLTEIPKSIYRLGPSSHFPLTGIRLEGNKIKNLPNDLPDWLRSKIGPQRVPKSIFTVITRWIIVGKMVAELGLALGREAFTRIRNL